MGARLKKITVVTPCYNEEANVPLLHEAVRGVMSKIEGIEYDHLFIDNASKDGTRRVLREIAARDPKVKAIFNLRNFGHIRSPYYALLQTDADATAFLASDLQDPPEMLAQFVERWRAGESVVMGAKEAAEESKLFFWLRKTYYSFVARIADINLTKNTTGFGIYDRRVIELLRSLDEPYPYFRGLIAELGFQPVLIPFKQPTRKRGISSQNFWTLYDIAMLGITSHSKIPLRLATMFGFCFCVMGFFLSLLFLVAKLVFWNSFTLGTAPILIGFFLFSSVQLLFIGVIGEYVGAIYTQVLKRPLVVESERIGF